MIQETLQSVGFTKSETKVFLALLDLGSSPVKHIIEKSGVASSKIYELLDKLIKKGLVSVVSKKNKRFYEAVPPSRILEYLNEKQQELQKQINNVKQILPELELKHQLAKEVSEVSVYKSLKGIESIFSIINEACKKGDEYCVYGAAGGINEVQKAFLLRHHMKRIKKGIKVKMLFSEKENNNQNPYSNLNLTKIKTVTQELVGPTQIMIIKDIVAIILWKENPLGIIIENKDIAKSYQQHFDYLWNQDTYVTEGFTAFESAWNDLFNQIKPGDSYDVFGARFGTKGSESNFAKYFKSLHEKRIKKGMKSKILFEQGAEHIIKKHKLEHFYSKDLEFKLLPFKSKFPLEIFPYKDTTLLLIQKKNPTLITIKNKEVTQGFINFFKAMWEQSEIVR